MTLQTTQKVPLTVWEDGSIRVKGTRLLIDVIIYAHKNGEYPEEIFESFPSAVYTVADIYSIVAYYLQNQAKLEKYLDKRENEARKVKDRIESLPTYNDKHNNLANKIKQKK